MVLSNLTNNVDLESRTIATMGDTLGNSWGMNRVMTEGKALIAQLIFLKTGNFFIKYKVEQFCMGLSLL